MFKKVNNKIIARLKNIVGDGNIFKDETSLETYSHDETPGIKGRAEVVVKVREKKHIVEVLKLASFEKIPVTPRGGGTGLSGGAVPIKGGIVLSVEKMNKIIDIDKTFRSVKVEAGVINAALQKEAENYGLFYPVNPASQDSCTIGGNVATGAGGADAVRYGTTKNYVIGVESVLSKGVIVNAGGSVFKNATDADLVGLMLGSEGILGIISGITLRLVPKPSYQAVLIAPFKKIENVFKAVARLWDSKFNLTMVEIMDRVTLKALEVFLNRKIEYSDCSAQLIVRLDEDRKEDIVELYEKAGEICLREGGEEVLIADTPLNLKKVWEMRSNIHEALVHYGLLADEDVVVPLKEVNSLVRGVKEIGEKHNVEISLFGHLGDGNIHVNFLKKGTKKTDVKIPHSLLKELFTLAAALKGKVSGEHGIGLVKRPYINLTTDPAYMDLKKKIKNIFDPSGIMNPGKIC